MAVRVSRQRSTCCCHVVLVHMLLVVLLSAAPMATAEQQQQQKQQQQQLGQQQQPSNGTEDEKAAEMAIRQARARQHHVRPYHKRDDAQHPNSSLGTPSAQQHPLPPPTPAGAKAEEQPPVLPQAPSPAPPPSPEDTPDHNVSTIAEIIDRALDKEFAVETKSDSESGGKTFNETATARPATVETVVRIKHSSNEDEEGEASEGAEGQDAAAQPGDAASGGSSGPKAAGSSGGASSGGGGTGGGSGAGDAAGEGSGGSSSSGGNLPSVEVGVDRIIDSQDNEFVLSAPKSSSVASLMLDPRLIQDLTLTLASSALFGGIFESIKQPVINGYLVAGAVVGPGGLQLIKELVQVESLAQLGVQLLLFGLGRELSMSKLRPVLRVALLGGTLQIAALMAIGGAVGGLIGGSIKQGVFVGALLSMSSTSVVIKCLETTKSTDTAYGQLTIGTLILQDCSVGLMFALMPAFAHRGAARSPSAAAVRAAAQAIGKASATAAVAGKASAEATGQGAIAAAAAAVQADNEMYARVAVVLLVMRVLFKLALLLIVAYAVARSVLPLLLKMLVRHASHELVQLSLVSMCLATAWLCGKAELSEELGAFVAGAMVASAERSLVAKGVLIPSIPLQSPLSSDSSPKSAAAAAAMAAASGSLSGHHMAPSAVPMCANIESISNVLTALFVASIGLIMSPVFLMHHATVLLLGTLVVVVIKTGVVAGVVQMFGVHARTAWAAGLTMAHTGEFSFVLLSMAHQLRLLPETLYMLLLGITATSLLSTPMVILLTHKLLHGTGGLGPQYQPVASACTELVRKVGGFYGTAHAPGGKEGLSPACDDEV